MNPSRLKSKLSLCLLGVLVLLQGCLKPNIQMPETPPSIVKAHDHMVIYGGSTRLRKTEVFLNEGDLFSVIATGGINFCPKSNNCEFNNKNLAKPDHFLTARIGDTALFSTGSLGDGGLTRSLWSGNLYFGYSTKYPEDDTGAFNIDIIVWSEENYGAIADFYSLLQQRNPEETQLRLASNRIEAQRKLAQASQEIKKTQLEIETLTKEISNTTEQTEALYQPKQPDGKIPKPVDEREFKIAQLELKLEQLEGLVAKMEEMKKGLEEEKSKSTELSRNLEQKEKREQELLARLRSGPSVPPVIVVASPEDNSNVEMKTVTLNGVVEDVQGIVLFEIFINDMPVSLENTRGIRTTPVKPLVRYDFMERIQLRAGDNIVRIVAGNKAGLTVEKSLRIQFSKGKNNIWAVIIGIDRYPKGRNLKYAVNDARAMYNYLVEYSQIPSENVVLLVDSDATLTRLRSELGTHLKNKASPDDMVIIFFAGHGATEKDMTSPDGDGLEKYLLPYDADPKDLYATALPMGEISRIFNRIRSDRLLFIADSCYSGASGGRTIGIEGIRANLSDSFFDRVTSGKGRLIISASGANEVSSESDIFQQGVFTYYFLQGLRGAADIDKDTLVTVDEAFRYVSYHVPEATDQEQHPLRKGTVTGNFIIGVQN